MEFKIIAKDKKSKARVGRITTAHGIVKTPSFVAVGTQAAVKGLSPKDLKETGVQVLFGNTYHLHLRPGEDVIEKLGGLGKFMGWNGPTITDSGGFQVFSLARAALRSLRQFGDPSNSNLKQSASLARANASEHESQYPLFKSSSHAKAPRASRAYNIGYSNEIPNLVKITEDGVVFRSHIDGSQHTFTPEASIEIQQKLGADMILAFDECVSHPSSHEYTKESMERTHAWAIRSLRTSQGKQFYSWKQALYGIIQGGVYKDLRVASAKFISGLDFDGIAIGGVSVGESKKQMRDALDWVVPILPEDKPRHLLGIGEIDDIFDAIERGMDTFDCVIPTRMGRYGFVFVSPPEGNLKNRFRIDINRSKFAKDQSPLSKDCKCYVCSSFTRGYVSHLFRVQELLAYRLASCHNLYFINNLVKNVRKAILKGRFEKLRYFF